ncbi:hypothetical protein QQ054_21030 [Oscillatoria amoena NRMC-F 0135]|nr:hypothetical protein [Oscillatoria amoena NRMC-F 0135]
MKFIRPIFLFVFPLLFNGCFFGTDAADDIKELLDASKPNPEVEQRLEKKKYTGEKKYFYENKKIKTIIRYKDGKRNGISVNFYKDGNKCVETEFKDGKKNGTLTWYFQNGKPYRVISYVNDKMQGPYTEYHHGGAVKFVAQFNEDMPCTGYKEYDYKGKEAPELKINVEYVGYNRETVSYRYKASLNQSVTNALFYMGTLKEGKCFDDRLIESPFYNTGTEAIIDVPVKAGYYYEIPITIIAKVTTNNNVDIALQRNYTINTKDK